MYFGVVLEGTPQLLALGFPTIVIDSRDVCVLVWVSVDHLRFWLIKKNWQGSNNEVPHWVFDIQTSPRAQLMALPHFEREVMDDPRYLVPGVSGLTKSPNLLFAKATKVRVRVTRASTSKFQLRE